MLLYSCAPHQCFCKVSTISALLDHLHYFSSNMSSPLPRFVLLSFLFQLGTIEIGGRANVGRPFMWHPETASRTVLDQSRVIFIFHFNCIEPFPSLFRPLASSPSVRGLAAHETNAEPPRGVSLMPLLYSCLCYTSSQAFRPLIRPKHL